MITWQERKELNEKKETVMKEFWQIVDPKDEGTITATNVFVRELQELCNISDNYATASVRLERYEDKESHDKETLQDYQDEVLADCVEFYTAFVAFAKKYSSESSRVHSAMGAKTSEKKASTSRENGKKGGRPRKTTNIITEG
jgi:hypothetical protein